MKSKFYQSIKNLFKSSYKINENIEQGTILLNKFSGNCKQTKITKESEEQRKALINALEENFLLH